MKVMSRWMLMFIGGFLWGGCLHGGASGKTIDLRRGFADVAELATPAVVFIQVEKQVTMGANQLFFNNPFDLFGEEFFERFGSPRTRPNTPERRFPGQGRERKPPTYKQSGQGSGFIISKDGYILTNTHVVGDADKITVKLNNGQEFTATRVGADNRTEVALIKIEAENLPVLAIGEPDNLRIGEWVVAIGNPFGLKETLTVGVVSAKGRSNVGITDYENFIQTDAAINPGNSGGPLLNIDGEVVGINTAIYSRSGGYMGIGFAVPIDMAMRIKEQLITNRRVIRGYIGVTLNPGTVSESMAKSFGRSEAGGILIADVEKDGPADKAGIKSGDIVLELNKKKTKGISEFRQDVAQIMPEEKAELLIFRDGKTIKKTVTVGEFPDDSSDESENLNSNSAELYGFRVQELSKELAARLGYEGEEGVIVSDVRPGSIAEEAGLRPGMLVMEVNRTPVKSLGQFEKMAGKGSKQESLLLRVKGERGVFFVNLKKED